MLIGADSLVVLDQGATAVSACKISQEGSTFFALSGLVEDRVAGLSVAAVARDATRSGASMPAKIRRFVEDVRPKLMNALDALKQDSEEDYRYLRSGRPMLQAIFADVQNGVPVMATVGFQLDQEGTLQHQIALVREGAPRLIYAGQQGRIREYLRAHRDWFGPDNESLIRTLVQLEVDAKSGYVGGAVDLLALDTRGARWVHRKPECSESRYYIAGGANSTPPKIR